MTAPVPPSSPHSATLVESEEAHALENAQLAGNRRAAVGELEAADPPAVVPALDSLGDKDKRPASPHALEDSYEGGHQREYEGWIAYRLSARHGRLSLDTVVEGVTVEGNGTRRLTLAGRMRAVGAALEHFVYRAEAYGPSQDELTLDIDVSGQQFSMQIPASGSQPIWRPFDLSGVDPELIQRGIDRLRHSRR